MFGGAHANYPGFPAYSRPVELFVPSIVWALIFLRYGLLPTILLHATFDLALFSIPVFLVDAPGARLQQALVVAAALVPLAIVAVRRRVRRAVGGVARGAAQRRVAAPCGAGRPRSACRTRGGTRDRRATRSRSSVRCRCSASPASLAWRVRGPFRADVPPLAHRSRAERSPRPTLRWPRAACVLGPRVAALRRPSSSRATTRSSGRGTSSCGGRRAPRRIGGSSATSLAAAAVGSALRDVRRRRRRARGGVARRDRRRAHGARNAPRAARGAPGRAPRARRGARRRATRRCNALRRRSPRR